ncbi:MAG: PIN domain-containing protein [Propionibacteriaceae bacterium]|jgi:predicted nucleic acid-binding protein|nr:PIN domain-containing protein [Propionibacteriaceae bacterium]
MIVLDASVLIAVLDPHDAHHQRAAAFVTAEQDEGMLIHPLTLAEVLVAPARVGKAAFVRRSIIASGVEVWDPDDDEPERLADLRVATGLKLPDCCVLDAAEHSSSSLATFDVRLDAVASRRGVRAMMT